MIANIVVVVVPHSRNFKILFFSFGSERASFWLMLLLFLVSFFVSFACASVSVLPELSIPPVIQHCKPGSQSTVFQSGTHLRVRQLVLDRSRLYLSIPNNEFKPAASRRDAFMVHCASDTFDFSKPAVTNAFGLSDDGSPNGQHFLSAVETLPQCHVRFPQLSALINRDWLRNIWHRVAHDLYPAFVSMKSFGVADEQPRIVHMDYAPNTFADMYAVISPNATWLRDLPPEKTIVCFDDVLFIVSRHWSLTFPETLAHPIHANPWVQHFRNWVLKRLQLDHIRSSFYRSAGSEVTVTWVSRDPTRPGFRAFKNEEELIPRIQQELDGRGALIQKIRFEDMSFREQLMVAASTDVLFGMHGAGLTHILWLPSHAVVLEVLPHDFNYLFYEAVSKVCGIRYLSFQNDDPKDAVEWTWEPHSKFTNLILRYEKIMPKFHKAISMLWEEKKTR
jgi:hypothetical protein